MTASDWPENWKDTRDAVWEDDLDNWEELDPDEVLLLREVLNGLNEPLVDLDTVLEPPDEEPPDAQHPWD
jgi:hypothetical protein